MRIAKAAFSIVQHSPDDRRFGVVVATLVVVWQNPRANAPSNAGRQALMAATMACSAPELWRRTSSLVFVGTHHNRSAHVGTGSGGGRSPAISLRMSLCDAKVLLQRRTIVTVSVTLRKLSCCMWSVTFGSIRQEKSSTGLAPAVVENGYPSCRKLPTGSHPLNRHPPDDWLVRSGCCAILGRMQDRPFANSVDGLP